MTNNELISIGAFAKLAGMTASALRFYDDAGLLRPEAVDPQTGYRLYSDSQLAHASQLLQLRAIGMPLLVIGRFYAADADEASQMIDEQVANVAADAAEVQQTASMLKASLSRETHLALGTLPGPVLAAALDQVIATTIQDPDTPVLGGVRVEAGPDAITLVATDRYRLAIRTLVPTHSSADTWAGIVAGEDLRPLQSQIRRSPTATLLAGEQTLGVQMTDGSVFHVRLLTETYPDYRMVIDALPSVTHHIALEKKQLLEVLERRAPEVIGVRITGGRPSLLLPHSDEIALAGSARGPDLTLWFELTTVYPALSYALGSDLMFDIHGADQPVTLRSADAGDLTTLVMPCRVPREPVESETDAEPEGTVS